MALVPPGRGSLKPGSRQLLISNAIAGGAVRVEGYRLRVLGGGGYQLWRAGERLGAGTFGRDFQGGGLSLKADVGPDGSPPVGAILHAGGERCGPVADDAARALAIRCPR